MKATLNSVNTTELMEVLLRSDKNADSALLNAAFDARRAELGVTSDARMSEEIGLGKVTISRWRHEQYPDTIRALLPAVAALIRQIHFEYTTYSQTA